MSVIKLQTNRNTTSHFLSPKINSILISLLFFQKYFFFFFFNLKRTPSAYKEFHNKVLDAHVTTKQLSWTTPLPSWGHHQLITWHCKSLKKYCCLHHLKFGLEVSFTILFLIQRSLSSAKSNKNPTLQNIFHLK